MKQALVVGSHSFFNEGSRVGLQFIAEGLAKNGYCVHYLPLPSTPMDLISSKKHVRFKRAWLQNESKNPKLVQENLLEYVIRAPFPFHKRYWIHPSQCDLVNILRPKWLTSTQFDITINETSPTFLFLKGVTTKHRILRLSDKPEGFGFHMSSYIIKRLRRCIIDGMYDEIWSVSEGLTDYINQLDPSVKVLTMPNGVDIAAYKNIKTKIREPKSAIYIGSIEKWFDVDLINESAKLLPEWKFNIYGPMIRKIKFVGDNIRYFGPLNYQDVPAEMVKHSVGMLPFCDVSDRMSVVERPLKFYGYLAAGLGIAATDIGGLRKGIGNWARFGNNPKAFAGAIIASAQDAAQRSNEETGKFLKDCSWDSIVQKMLERIDNLES
jgi:glycosyltransferase involved in cell wall biosynthesis